MFYVCIIFRSIFQLARTDIMAKTVLVFVPQTASHVHPLTELVVVTLVGWGKTVLLVFVKLVKIFQHSK